MTVLIFALMFLAGLLSGIAAIGVINDDWAAAGWFMSASIFVILAALVVALL